MVEYLKRLQFFRAGIKILVKAENKSRRYGQENPAFNPNVSVVIGVRHFRHQSDKSHTGRTEAG